MSEQNIQQNTPSFEDVSKESLIELLRDKGRELQKIQKKLDKLSEQYVQTFNKNKLINKDREIMEKILQCIFNEDPFQFTIKPIGSYDLAELNDCWQKREDEKQRTLNSLLEATNKEKYALEEKQKLLTDKNIKGMDQQTQQIVQQLKSQVNDLEQNNTNLAKEVIELNDIIQIKNHEVQQLKMIEDEFSTLKTQMMVQDLEKQSQMLTDYNDINRRIQQSDGLSEKLIMKNRMEQMLEENRLLKVSLKQTQSQFDILKQQNEVDVSTKKQSPIQHQTSILPDSASSLFGDYENPFEGVNQKQQSKMKDSKQHISIGIQTILEDELINIDLNESNIHSDIKDRYELSGINEEYLKNVLFKYFLYQETKNYKEASMLKHAIITIMKMTKEERQYLEEARIKSGVWQQAKTYVTDNVFCYKQGLQPNASYIQPELITPKSSQSLNHQMNQFNHEMK